MVKSSERGFPMNTLIKQMSDFRNNFLMILAVFAVLVGCEPAKHQTGTATMGPIEIFETSQGFVITEGKAKVMLYQREHKSLNGNTRVPITFIPSTASMARP